MVRSRFIQQPNNCNKQIQKNLGFYIKLSKQENIIRFNVSYLYLYEILNDRLLKQTNNYEQTFCDFYRNTGSIHSQLTEKKTFKLFKFQSLYCKK